MDVLRSTKNQQDQGVCCSTGRLGRASERGFKKENTLVCGRIVGAWTVDGSSACLVVELPFSTTHHKPAVRNCLAANCYRPCLLAMAYSEAVCHSERENENGSRQNPGDPSCCNKAMSIVDCRWTLDPFLPALGNPLLIQVHDQPARLLSSITSCCRRDVVVDAGLNGRAVVPVYCHRRPPSTSSTRIREQK